MVFQRHSKNKTNTQKMKEINIWGSVIICLLQMCNDFPCGIVNVNRISRSIITFPQAAEKTRACGYFCSVGLSQSRDEEDPHGRKGVPHPHLRTDEKTQKTVNNKCVHGASCWTQSWEDGKGSNIIFQTMRGHQNSSVRWQKIST